MRGRDTNTSLSHTRQTPNVQVEQCTHFLMNSVGLVFVSVFFCCCCCHHTVTQICRTAEFWENQAALVQVFYEISLTFFGVFHSLCYSFSRFFSSVAIHTCLCLRVDDFFTISVFNLFFI